MTTAVDAVFAALADPTRRGLFDAVVARGPVSATELADDVPISRQAVSKHLRILDDAGLVEARRRGRATMYEARPTGLREISDWVRAVDASWDRRLGRLHRQLGGA